MIETSSPTSPICKISPRGFRPKTLLTSLSAFALIALSACTTAHQAPAQPDTSDILSVDHAGAKPLGKTEYAEVIRVELAPGETITPHQGGDRVILSLNDYAVSFIGTEQSSLARFQAGDIHFRPAGLHMVENLGSSPARFVIFERLASGALPEGEPSAVIDDTPVPNVRASEIELFSNTAFDVYDVSIAPGGSLAPHMGYARAVYSLDDYEVEFHENGETKKRTFNSGQVHFHEPGTHWLKNVGRTQADFIVIDYKR